MGKFEDQSKAIKQRNAVENIGGICVIASRDYMEAAGKCIAAIPGKKTRADAQGLFEMWRRSPEYEFIVFGVFTGHTGISGSIAMSWEDAQTFVLMLRARMDAGVGGYFSHWVQLVSEDRQRELAVLLGK